MQKGLADSLTHILEQAHGVEAFDSATLEALVRRLSDGVPAGPATFARYYDLVLAIARDDLAEANRLVAAMAAKPEPLGEFVVLPMGDERMGGLENLYRAKMETDASVSFHFLPPPAELVAPFTARIANAMALFDTALPEISGEIRALISEVILAVGRPDTAYVFDGGSSYMLWGALFLNPSFHDDRIQMAEVLAHETAHTLLFGFTTDEPLVHNPHDDLFPSPLRRDPRPMDGIYHATFVSARMHWVMSRLAASGLLKDEERSAALNAAERDGKNFQAGYETVQRFADCSKTGAALIAGAAEYMRGVG